MRESITLETLRRAMQELEMAQMDRELEILLSDNGPAVLSLLHGGQIVEAGGNCYVVSGPELPDFFWRFPSILNP